ADANGPMLAALVARDGGIVDFPGLVADESDVVRDALHTDADVVIVSGGSSVGIDDIAPAIVAQDGELAVHGIAMRPSSPTGLGRIGRRLVFLLPGNPVSCLCAYDFFAGRAIRALGGRTKAWPYHAIRARLARKISSPIGRLDYARVQVVDGTVEPLAVGGASVLSSTTRADGFVVVPSFDRSSVDGFAVVAENTFGASEQAPRCVQVGEEAIHTGVVPKTVIRPGTAVSIATGGMVPRGADAVVMVEYAETHGREL